MRVQLTLRAILLDGLKISILVALFSVILCEVVGIRRDLYGKSNGLTEADRRYSEELNKTRQLIRTAMETSNHQVSHAQKFYEKSTEMLEEERHELARLIDDRTGKIEATLKSRLEEGRGLLEDARNGTELNAAMINKLERNLHRDQSFMKRKMIFPTVQLRGSGTVGSGVLIYSRPQGEKKNAVSFILTAYHVVTEVMGGRSTGGIVDGIRILSSDSEFNPEVYSAELALVSKNLDLALLRLRSNVQFPNVAEFTSRKTFGAIDIFTRAYAVGCPLGNRPMPTAGEISSKRKVVGSQVFWMINAPTFFGNSGGGVYLASNCKLIGISSMVYTYGRASPTVVPHMGLFVPLGSLYQWLDEEGYSFLYKGEPIPLKFIVRFGLQTDEPSKSKPSA